MVDAKYKDTLVLKGGEVFRLEADVAGRPPPTLTWTKDEKELEDTGKLEIKKADFSTVVINKDSARRDGGAYTLTASNPGGFAKHIFNVKVLDRPGPPEGPLAVSEVTSEKCVLSWLPPLDDGGAKIDHYVVEKRETSRLAWTNVASEVPVTKQKVTNLLKGNEYVFRVMAVNKYGVGEVLESEPILAVNPYVPPDPPKTPEVTAITKDSMIVCWGRPDSDGGSPITNYIVERRDRAGLRWVKCNKRVVTDLRYKVSGLTEGHEYEYRIMAENAAGISEPSPSSQFYKACDTVFKPGPPGNPRVLDTSKSSITIAWNKPIYDGGSEITGYMVEIALPEEDEWKIVTPSAGLKATSFTIIDLKENQEYKIRIYAMNSEGIGEPALVPGSPKRYEFRVIARNAAGVFSEPSESSGAITVKDEVEPPRISMDPKYKETIIVNAGESFKIDADVYGKPLPSIHWLKGDHELANTARLEIKSTDFATSLSVKEAIRVDSGHYVLLAKNVHADVPGTVIVEEKLEAPDLDLDLDLRKIVNVRAGGSLRLFVPIRGRPTPEVKWGKMDGEIREAAIIDITSSFTSLVLDNVNRFDTGKYTLTLENSSGIKSAFVSVRVLDTPSPPVNLKIKEVTKDSVSLSWEPPLLDGGAKIKNYIVEKREATRKAYAAVATNCHKTSWKVDQLQEGSNYYFRVTAENEFGIGLPAETIDPIKVSEVPQPPGKITVDDVTRNSVLLNWSKPEHDGGSKILQYNVEMQVKGSDKWSECACVKALEALITNLTQGEEYLFRVIAVNEKGRSDPRSLAVPVVAKDLVIEPDVRPAFHSYSIQVGQDLKVEIPISGRPKPTVTWTKDGQPLKQTTRVNVNDLPNLTVLNIKETHKEDSGMYGITVANVIGQKSACVEIITLDKPDPPRGPVKFDDISAESITASWNPPLYTGGCQITNYIVHKRDTTTTVWETVSAAVARTTLKVTKLKTGSEYQFRIFAENRYGQSFALESEPVVAQYPYREPGPPGTPFVTTADVHGKPLPTIKWFKGDKELEETARFTGITSEKCSLSWNPPLYDGGSDISHYIVEKRETSRLAWTVVAS
uniref:Titin n=1 Tax=Gopherus evgoodei TaxID=1825980 RepID=A0A8C4YLT8_9SAUR